MAYNTVLRFTSFVMNLFRKGNRKKWVVVRSLLTTPQKIIQYYINNNFVHQNDRFPDNYQQPEVFIVTLLGDCDDFAKMTFEILKFHGFTCWFVGMWKSVYEGHAIVIYLDKSNGLYYYISNKKIVGAFTSFDTALHDYYKYDKLYWEIIDKANV